MRSPSRPLIVPARQRILQVHPSLRCNLACQHCYSESAPGLSLAVEPDLLVGAVTDAARLGYRVLAVSGGEPLLYDALPAVLDAAHAAGMATTMTTNGLLLGHRRAGPVLDRLDGLAISVEGPPELHDAIRGRTGAFNGVTGAAAVARERGLPFGFITTLTERSWRNLAWLADFAVEEEARLLQVHPLEMVGRAVRLMGAEAPDEEALARAFLIVTALRAKYDGVLTIGLDLLLRDEILRDPEIVYAGDGIAVGRERAGRRTRSDDLGLLVVEADGTLSPISYGFARHYSLGNLREVGLAEAFDGWESGGRSSFRTLCRSVFEEIVGRPHESLVNWHERIVARSHSRTPGRPVEEPRRTSGRSRPAGPLGGVATEAMT